MRNARWEKRPDGSREFIREGERTPAATLRRHERGWYELFYGYKLHGKFLCQYDAMSYARSDMAYKARKEQENKK